MDIYNPRGKAASFIRRSIPIIDSILGNIGDIKVKNGLNDALKELQGFKKQRDDYSKFNQYQSALLDAQQTIMPEDEMKLTNDYDVNTNGLEETEAYKTFKIS